MKLLAVDIGTGTQDIYLFDSRQDLENGFKMVLPSPTMIVFHRIQQATRRKIDILLTGNLMGGGPSTWATEAHLKAGLSVYSTPEAALSINDDLDAVRDMGILIIGDDEAKNLSTDILRIEFGDFNFKVIQRAFLEFGICLDDIDAAAVAVFDHGAAPFHISDRQFRFDYLDHQIRQYNRLSAFAYLHTDIPTSLTRLQSVADSASSLSYPVIVMDTAPAAILGASLDPVAQINPRKMIVNIGNFHTLAFRLGLDGIEGVFEHHTGLLDQTKLEKLLISLADGTLTHQEVFNHHGHGALVYSDLPLDLTSGSSHLVVTGPRRSLLVGSSLNPYFAVPYGDMMIAGCFGLLAATADLLPDYGSEIRASLFDQRRSGTPPWELQI